MNFSHLGLSMVESYGFIFRHYNYDEIKYIEKLDIIPKMNIYMVLEVPKVRIITKSILLDVEKISFDIEIHEEDDILTHKIVLENYTQSKLLKTRVLNNRSDLCIEDHKGSLIYRINTTILLLSKKIKEFNCKVLYVGRSYGNDGESTVYSRLKSHSTLQKIYAEKDDNVDIFLSAWKFDRNTITFISPGVPGESDSNDLNLIMQQMNMSRSPYEHIDKKQEINFTEAALIRYFQPKYNGQMKYNFPSNIHKEYSDLFEQKIDYLSVELDTKRLNIKLYSDEVNASRRHAPWYDLKDKRSIKEFFKIG